MTRSKSIFLILAFLVCGSLFGQDTFLATSAPQDKDKQSDRKDFRYAAKLGATLTFRNWDPTWVLSSGTFASIPEHASIRFDGFRPAFQVKRPSGNIHEFSLMPKVWQTVQAPNQTIPTSNIQFGHFKSAYGYFIDLTKSKTESPFAFFLGLQANPYFTALKLVPIASSVFQSSDYVLGVQGQIVPRIAWYSSKRFFADLSVELTVFDSFIGRTKTNNPVSSIVERTHTRTRFRAVPMYHSVSASIGVKI